MLTSHFQVRFSETDALGHVNNTVYYVYMEEARKPLFEIFNPGLDTDKWNLIIARTSCDYLKQVKYGEELRVETFVEAIGTKSVTIHHDIYIELTGEKAASGSAVMVYFNYDQNQSEPIPAKIRERLMLHRKGE